MSDITLLDGSIGQELVKRSGDRATPLWSTRMILDDPDSIGALHADYFAVGATIATTNTYAVHRSRLERLGLEDQVPALIDTAVSQAEMARARYNGGRIAGSLGPLLASYRPDLEPDIADAALKFSELVQLMKPRVDLFLIETVSSVQEAEGVLRGTLGCGKPIWLALTVQDEDGTRLRSGEPLKEIVPLLDKYQPEAILLNCSRPEAITLGLDVLRDFGRPYGAYANAFTHISDAFLQDAPVVDVLTRRADMPPSAYADHAMEWGRARSNNRRGLL